MNDELHLSPAGAHLVQAFEGLLKKVGHDQYKAYRCPANVLTIGWGTTNEGSNHFDASTVWSKAQCDAAFLKDMVSFENSVKKLVKVKLHQWQFDALVSFAYNCGAGNLQKSTLLKKVNASDFAGAAKEFAKWNKGGGRVLSGLVRRRASEALLFQNITDADYDGRPDKIQIPMVEVTEPMPQLVDAPEEV
jgi:lysozyme